MKTKILFVLFAVLICPSIAHGQGPIVPTGTQHQVTLTWQPPATVGGSGVIAGYNVYRTPSGPPNYTKLNGVLVTGLTLLDTTVIPGAVYGYCATTVDSVATESACTIPVNATVPSNPNAPVVFTATPK